MNTSIDRLPAEALQILRAFRSAGDLAPGRAVTFSALREHLVCERDGWYQRFRRGLAPLVRSGLIEEVDKPARGPAHRYVLTADGQRLAAEAFPRAGRKKTSRE